MLGNISGGIAFGVRERDDGSGDIEEVYVKFGDETTLAVIDHGNGRIGLAWLTDGEARVADSAGEWTFMPG